MMYVFMVMQIKVVVDTSSLTQRQATLFIYLHNINYVFLYTWLLKSILDFGLSMLQATEHDHSMRDNAIVKY